MAAKLDTKRRYGSVKETMAYVLFDSSKSFNIDAYSMRYLIDVLKLDLNLNTLAGLINGIWDIINDSFIGAIVDKTATRFGKFRPYLLALSVPGTLLACVYWLMPLFLSKDPMDTTKFIVYLLLAMVRELNGTFQSVAETGLLGTLTPSPTDRAKLYTQAEVISAIWESIPEVTMGLLIDLVNKKVVSFSLQSVFVGMGLICTLVAGVLGVFFFFVGKERITASSHERSYKEGIRSILNNRPMLMIMLSEIAGTFNMSGGAAGEQNYFIDVLGSASLRNIVTIPGIPLSFFSYTYYSKLRERTSIKTLWIVGRHIKDIFTLLIFAVGSIGGKTNGLYKKIGVMLPAFMLRDMVYKGTLSLNKVPAKEILTDALDYCEWKNGFRSEGITLTTKGMIVKVFNNITGSMNTAILKRVGYSINAGYGNQSDSTKFALFAICMLMPAFADLLSIIPKLFYDLHGEKRDRMYEELTEMRALKRQDYQAQTEEPASGEA